MEIKKVCVIGLGYIGLPTCGILATNGIQVYGVDVVPDVVNIINTGKIHIFEPYLDVMIHDAVKSNMLKASLKPDYADAFMICVPTPFKENHEPDLSYVEQATEAIAPYIKKDNIVILESTSPPETTKMIAEILEKKTNMKAGSDFYVAYCPERVLPGFIIKELVENNRNIGGIDRKSAEKAKELYKIFVKGNIYITDSVTAEMSKLVENTYRDINIAFANELSIICDKLNINIFELIELANKHPRVNIHQPGAGVGGHCIAVDPWFIVSRFKKEAQIIRTAREINDNKPFYIIEKISDKVIELKKEKDEVVVGCFGISYKADIDDIRESPSFTIVEELLKKNSCSVMVCDPYVYDNKLVIEKINFKVQKNHIEVIKKSDILVLLVEHTPFKELNRKYLEGKIIIDTKGIWEK